MCARTQSGSRLKTQSLNAGREVTSEAAALLQFSVNPELGVPATTFNAPRTLHQGLELGAGLDLARGLFESGDQLSIAQLWNHSDFRFRDHRIYGGNRIAGIANDVLRTLLTYAHPSGVQIAPTID
jgi:iron complex outermembrane receptor protein